MAALKAGKETEGLYNRLAPAQNDDSVKQGIEYKR
jgi:hypothetical protein